MIVIEHTEKQKPKKHLLIVHPIVKTVDTAVACIDGKIGKDGAKSKRHNLYIQIQIKWLSSSNNY